MIFDSSLFSVGSHDRSVLMYFNMYIGIQFVRICTMALSLIFLKRFIYDYILWATKYVLDDFSSSLFLTNLFNYDLGIVYFWGET